MLHPSYFLMNAFKSDKGYSRSVGLILTFLCYVSNISYNMS